MKIRYQYEEENDYSFRRGLRHFVIRYVVGLLIALFFTGVVAGLVFFFTNLFS